MGRVVTKKTSKKTAPRPYAGPVAFNLEEEIKALERATKKICATPESAFEFLVKNGYLTPKGKITKRYK